MREVKAVIRLWKQHLEAVLHVDRLPDRSHLEADSTEYADAVRVRAVDEKSGLKSPWSTLPVRDGRVEVTWDELWSPPDSFQPDAREGAVPDQRKPPS
jgi:hypothetical protein